MQRITDPEVFWRRSDKSGPPHPMLGTACWTWMLGRNAGGYGCATFDGLKSFAHRISWTLTFGPIPEGLCVCHHCDNPPCVNPAHLFLGTREDNNHDKTLKGRGRTTAHEHPEVFPRGAAHTNAVFTEQTVRDIRAIHARGVANMAQLAREHMVSKQAIRRVVRRETWRHVT